MNEVTELYKEWRAVKKQQKATRAANALVLLKGNNIVFTSVNNGVQLVVEGPVGFIDYWPTTSRWKCRQSGDTGFGITGLLGFLKHK
jgi:hypothetical protein